ncbi:Crp/Fnr family transcriptional regulator [Modicisalibacter radicis]|uniref:Crp/Fnr family transcriptional regulator n=1 Tax=Halomonas sp. EAR18 TaxID=2518972 RepID=UPI00109C051F|nr:Crp/Fnr family transcriptional regulator [Halomonas sp. EAR18]
MLRNESCILANLNQFFPLGENEQQLLKELEKTPHRVTEKQVLWAAGDKVDQLYTLKSGWAYTCRDNLDGARQVVDIVLPGDVLGLRELTFATHLSQAQMITEGVICPFPNHKIIDIIEASTPLTVALLASLSRQESILTERMLMSIHRSARSRIAHFIVETYTRLNRVRSIDFDSFYLPISQKVLGEILGLTSVHISRSLTSMERERVLIKHRDHIQVLDREKLYEEADFDGSYISDNMNGLRERLKQHGFR